MRQLLSKAREVQLLIQLFNKINCWYVEGLKVILLVTGIIHGYLGIRLRQNNVVIAAFCGAMHGFAILSYCGTFIRAYRLQDMQKNLKRELKAACGRLSLRTDYLRRRESFMTVTALSCPGLKVGRFHEMERQSALIFIDFLETQVISLLVAF